MVFAAVNILSVLFMLCVATQLSSTTGHAHNNTTDGTAAPSGPKRYNATYLPSVYVTVDLDMTWPAFCMLDNVFRHRIASLIFDRGIAITPGRVVIHNYDEHCSTAEKNYKKAVLVLYITKHDGGHQSDVHVDLTNQLYKKLAYLVDSKNQWELRRVFDGQVIKVSAGGKNAEKLPDKITEFAHTWIAIAIATAILILIVIILTIIHYVRKPKTQVNGSVSYKSRDPEHGAVINPSVQPEPVRSPPITENYSSSTKL